MTIDYFRATYDPDSAVVQFTYTVPWHEMALPEEDENGTMSYTKRQIKDVYLSEMLHHILLNHGRRLRAAIFDPLMEGMLEPEEDVIDPALVAELRSDFDCAMRARVSPVAT